MNNHFNYDDYNNEEKKVQDKNLKMKSKVEITNQKNLIISISLILVIIVLIVGFLVLKPEKENTNTTNNNNNNTGNEVKDPTEEEKPINIINPDSKTRPYAVMINCHNGALPHAGLQNAYIVYELMVEGGITRMMALFKDVDVSKIGSVRSARTQYLDYVYENDAIYVHAGGAPDALKRITDEKISDIDVDGVYGFRDTSLNRSWEHTLFTSTEKLLNGVNNKGIRKTTEVDNILTYQAKELNMNQYKDKKVANNISIKYSDYRTSNYTYNEETKTYLRSMNNTKNVDLVTGEQYQVKNILVYAVKHSSYKYGGNSKYQKLDNTGSGEGYYITGGYAIPITWQKDSKNSRTIYKVKSTGKELVLNDGNTYIQIYPTSGNLVID